MPYYESCECCETQSLAHHASKRWDKEGREYYFCNRWCQEKYQKMNNINVLTDYKGNEYTVRKNVQVVEEEIEKEEVCEEQVEPENPFDAHFKRLYQTFFETEEQKRTRAFDEYLAEK